MKIAVLSGKGGTGKTFISVNLACVAGEANYVDCDVEEPNGHLFLKPRIFQTHPVTVEVPILDKDKCTSCRKCVDFCKYNALALIQERLLFFHEVCHSCGGCILFCPEKALAAKQRKIGAIETGMSNHVTVITGYLNIGEVSGVPIIKGLLNHLPTSPLSVIDCPPGSACAVMESIKEADFCVLVAEPTPFGIHNLSMVLDLVQLFHKPFGIVLNKCLQEENPAKQFCSAYNLPIFAEFPFDKELGILNSNGKIAARENLQYRKLFEALLHTITKEAAS